MSSTTFFIIFIPILSTLLLCINLILAPHNPYQEKDSVFECGFHSFLGQNRTQFSVSFFIFALLFLLFDLEILLVYPYSVSGYSNDIYGLIIMMVFFILLTLGFIFELGKNALSIDSKQTSSYNTQDEHKPDVFVLKDSTDTDVKVDLHNPPKPHAFTSLPLQSSMNSNNESDYDSIDEKADDNQWRLDLIDEYKEWQKKLKDLERILDKDPNEINDEDKKKWNEATTKEHNEFLVKDEINKDSLDKEIESTKQAINRNKDELRDPDNYYADVDDLSENESLSLFILPMNFPLLSILFFIIRNWSLYPLYKLYLIYSKDRVINIVKDFINSNYFAISIFSLIILGVILHYL